MRTQEFNGYDRQLSSLAWKGLTSGSIALGDALPGESIAAAIPAAKLLLVSDVSLHVELQRGFEAVGKLTGMMKDPAGHRRPIYLPLAFHLLLTAWQRHIKKPLPVAARDLSSRMLAKLDDTDTAIDATLWKLLCLYQVSMMTGDEPLWKKVVARLNTVIASPGEDGSLHVQDPDDSLDAWTYRELVGLHALFHLAVLMNDDVIQKRCGEIARFHLENTQPDNTTNQPWGIAAFLSDPATASMGVQQMHDAMAQGSSSASQNVGLVAAMLLADAASVLAKYMLKHR